MKKQTLFSQKAPSHLIIIALVVFGRILAGISLQAAQIETTDLRLTLSPDDGRCELLDKQAHVLWQPSPGRTGFGAVVLVRNGRQERLELSRCEIESRARNLTATFHPLPEQASAGLRVTIGAVQGGKSLDVSYEADSALDVKQLSLLDDLLGVSESSKGYILMPVR